jgi:receptor protein-tyrosine kinase
MSLVETALKKMQLARGGDPQPDNAKVQPQPQPLPAAAGSARLAHGVIAEVTHRGSHRPLENSNVHASDKLVRVDAGALRAAGLAPPESQQRELADQYRNIKRPLIGAAIGRGAPKIDRGQLIMMASALSGEGKTFTAINLALSMALEKDISVLLVDADIPKPHISRTFGVDREAGLMEVLRDDKINVESLIIPTDIGNLSLLPAGQRSDTATELLSSHRMEETVNYLVASNPSRIVLIDSPPLLLTSESRVLAQWVGQILLVVRADTTPQQAVMDAIGQLGAEQSISLVLNQSMHEAPGYYYGYGDATSASPT